jgi:hypothetical protein
LENDSRTKTQNTKRTPEENQNSDRPGMGIQPAAAVTVVYYILSLLFLWNTTILQGEAFAMTTTTTPPSDDHQGGASIGATTTSAGTAAGRPRDDSSLTGGESSDDIPRLLPAGENDKDIPVFKLGETISFENLGPIILNVDGTTRRIANWDDMTEPERQTTWRRIKVRNEQRRQHLLQLQQEQQQQVEEASQQQQQQQIQEPVNPGDKNNADEL